MTVWFGLGIHCGMILVWCLAGAVSVLPTMNS
ncbi:MAG: hypothetical protein QOE51_5058, partial [Actinoplanes sp.]|nr:hypothetical protein [Actinoplanes sp.]